LKENRRLVLPRTPCLNLNESHNTVRFGKTAGMTFYKSSEHTSHAYIQVRTHTHMNTRPTNTRACAHRCVKKNTHWGTASNPTYETCLVFYVNSNTALVKEEWTGDGPKPLLYGRGKNRSGAVFVVTITQTSPQSKQKTRRQHKEMGTQSEAELRL
jgi:hypothetical protein